MTLVRAALDSSDLSPDNVRAALVAAKRGKNAEVIEAIEKKVASLPAAAPAFTVERNVLQSYVASYRNEAAGNTFVIAQNGDQLVLTPVGGQPLTLVPTTTTTSSAPSAARATRRSARGSTAM